MKGQLHQHPLAELIREISRAGLSGALRLERELARAAVYFEAGEMVYAASNVRALRLTECLRRWHAVTDKQLAAAGAQDSDMKLAHALFAAGLFTRERIDELLARQASEVLRLTLLWTEGSWNFDPRVSLSEQIKGHVEMGRLLLESARRLPPEFVAARFSSGSEIVSPAQPVPQDLSLRPEEAFVLSRVDMPLRISELTVISGLPETATLCALYTLTLGGFLERENWPRAFKEEEIRRALAMRASAAAQAEAAANVALKETKEAAETTTVADAVPEYDERRELDQLFARLDQATDYYQVLDVDSKAELSEIKRAYHSLAKRFHPDRFHQDAGVHARVEDAFAKIAQAYETLKDRRSRSAYDFKLDGR